MKIYRDGLLKGAKKQIIQKEKDNEKGEVGEKKKKKYSIHLKTSEDLRRLLCEVVNELRKSDEGNLCSRSSRIITAAQVLLNIFQQSDLEERIQKLEELSGYGGR